MAQHALTTQHTTAYTTVRVICYNIRQTTLWEMQGPNNAQQRYLYYMYDKTKHTAECECLTVVWAEQGWVGVNNFAAASDIARPL